MKIIAILLLICCVIISPSASDRSNTQRMRAWRATAIANKLFGHRLFSTMTRATNDTFFISPYAVSAGLSMTLYGARRQTSYQIIRILGYQERHSRIPRLYKKMLDQMMSQNFGFTLVSANRMFGEQSLPFRRQFVNGVERYYGAGFEEVNFSSNPNGARTIINNWVANMTNNTIKDAMPASSITSNTLLALVSTLYFKGTWVNPFTSEFTDSFTAFNGVEKNIKFMQGKFITYYWEAILLNCHYLQLPYKSSSSKYKVVMELLLPFTNDNNSLRRLETQLSEGTLDDATHHKTQRLVNVILPKFRLEYEKDLKDILITMGITDLFNDRTADLSGISKERHLSLNTADHKTFLEVNRDGTTAGASFSQTQNRMEVPTIKFDHPFVVIIREQHTQMPLFMGRIASLDS